MANRSSGAGSRLGERDIRFAWRAGLVSAATGTAILPPWLGVAVVLPSMTAGGALLLFVAGAWAAVGVGMVVAVLSYVGKTLRAWRIRRRERIRSSAEWRLASRHRDLPRWRLRRGATLSRVSPPRDA